MPKRDSLYLNLTILTLQVLFSVPDVQPVPGAAADQGEEQGGPGPQLQVLRRRRLREHQ